MLPRGKSMRSKIINKLHCFLNATIDGGTDGPATLMPRDRCALAGCGLTHASGQVRAGWWWSHSRLVTSERWLMVVSLMPRDSCALAGGGLTHASGQVRAGWWCQSVYRF